MIALLNSTRQIVLHAHRSALEAGPLLPGNEAVVEYLRVLIAHSPVEEVRVLFLNAANELISDESLGRGTIDRSAIHPREVIRRAIELGALRLILAHNHPSGSPEPSPSDVSVTRAVAQAAGLMGMELLDHLIVGTRGVVSMRAAGLL